MKVGLAFASSIGIDGPDALQICRRAEAVGFESVWGGEHVILPDAIASAYPYSVDGKIPAQPDTPIPDPLILAKELATLDRLSGGRVELGLGVGWMREEFDALGVPWERRGARNDEYIAAMRALWAGPHAEFHGEFVDFAPATCSPRPVQKSIPILVGGDTDAAISRAVRIADGYFPGEGDAVRLGKLIARLHAAAERADRDPSSIEINAMFGTQMADPVAGVEEMKALGVGRIMVPAFFFAGPGGLDRLSDFGERVVTAARG